MNDANWEDLQLFFHVATGGGLSSAAVRTGLSAPSIGRRMLALERVTGRS
ncbi:LysR family transcriptional regulator, partial [Rhizobium ruizarguesonis]